MPKHYALTRYGNLLTLRAAIGGRASNVIVIRLLLDTGASFTMLPVEVVEALGYETYHPVQTKRIVAANGVVIAPQIEIDWISCLGQRIENFPVIAHTLPESTLIDGLLGMDFLRRCQAIVDIGKANVTCG